MKTREQAAEEHLSSEGNDGSVFISFLAGAEWQAKQGDERIGTWAMNHLDIIKELLYDRSEYESEDGRATIALNSLSKIRGE